MQVNKIESSLSERGQARLVIVVTKGPKFDELDKDPVVKEETSAVSIATQPLSPFYFGFVGRCKRSFRCAIDSSSALSLSIYPAQNATNYSVHSRAGIFVFFSNKTAIFCSKKPLMCFCEITE